MQQGVYAVQKQEGKWVVLAWGVQVLVCERKKTAVATIQCAKQMMRVKKPTDLSSVDFKTSQPRYRR